MSLTSKKLFAPLAVTLLCIAFNPLANAQGDKAEAAKQECEKVMLTLSNQTGKNYGDDPCSTNVYPKSFWQCVNDKLSQFDLSMSIYFCEKEYGFK